MPITDLAQTWREIGRIRTGQRSSGDGTPEKLLTFRLTSTSEAAIRAAAAEYGGIAQPWQRPAGPAWQVVTEAAQLEVTIPPGDVFSQWWERWTAAGRERQCDGTYDRQGGVACRCPEDIGERLAEARRQRACRPITRLAVILPRLPDLGVWRLEAHGLIAARELGATMTAVGVATAQGHYIPGRLRLDQRRSRRPGEKPHDYGIPVLELPELRAGRLLEGAGTPPPAQLPGPEEPPDIDDVLDEADTIPAGADEPAARTSAATASRAERPAGVDEDTPASPPPITPPPTGSGGGSQPRANSRVPLERDATRRAATDRQAFIDRHGFPPEDIDPDSATFLGPEPEWLTPRAPEPAAVAPGPTSADPYPPEELEARLAELHAAAEERHRTGDEAELYLATEAHLLHDPQAVAHAPRRAWQRTLLKLRAGDYDPTPLERAHAMASRRLEERAAHDRRTRQAVPDPVER